MKVYHRRKAECVKDVIFNENECNTVFFNAGENYHFIKIKNKYFVIGYFGGLYEFKRKEFKKHMREIE